MVAVDACPVAGYRELAWNAGWHLREDTYRPGLAIIANTRNHRNHRPTPLV